MTVTDPNSRKYTLTWTGSHITGLADTAGRQITYGYDDSGNLTDVYGVGTTRTPVLKDDDHAKYTYDANHLMTSMRTPANFAGSPTAVTSMVYDSAERVHTQTDPNGHTTTFTYGPDGGLATGQTLTTDPAGHKKLDTYQNGLLISETKGYGTSDAGTTSYTYDPVTLGVTTQTDPDGGAETFTYDDQGNKTSESNALGFTTNYVYDGAGNLLETIDPNGVATVNQYDQSGHIPVGAAGVLDLTSTTITRANNVVESTTGNFGPAPIRTANFYYDDAQHPSDRTRVVDPNGKTATAAFDAFGDKISVTDAAGDKAQSGYDTETGWLTSTVDENGTAAGVNPGCTPPAKGCTSYRQDADGNVIATTDPLNHTNSATYDADGNKTSTTDANHHTTVSTFDPAGQRVKVTQPDNTTQITDYNSDGTISDTVNGLNAKTTYGYDGQGRENSRTDPDNRTTRSHLDPAGRVVTSTDATGRVTTIGYDPAGETQSVKYSDGVTPNVTYGYDPDGHRVTMTDFTGTSTWTYDAFGEVVAQTQGSGAAVAYGYDDDGNQTSITYPGHASPVVRTFDDAGRLKTVVDWNDNKTTFGYDNDGTPRTTTYPNGTTVTDGVDDADQLISTTAVTGATTVFSATYGRDPVGQLSNRAVGSASQSFGYNAKEQLASDGSAAYSTDAADNPTTVGATTQSFDAAGQLCWTLPGATAPNPTCATPPAGAATVTFDGVGNRKTAGSATYGYDQAARLTTFTGPSTSATYRYNGDGLRTSKTVGGVTTTFVWDNGGTPNILTDGTTSYLYGPGRLPIEQIGTSSSSWFVHDQIGSTLALLDGAGAVAGSYTYTPYGVATSSGSASTPLRYTGQYTDSESGLVYLRARYYDPATALFISVDPLLDTTRTPYTYAGGNPLQYADRTGLSFWDSIGLGLAIGGAIIGGIGCAILEPCGAIVAAGVGVAEVGAGLAIGVAAAAGAGAAVLMGGTMYAATGGGGLDDSVLRNWDSGDNYDDDGRTTSSSRENQQQEADSAWNEIVRRVRQLTGKTLTNADRRAWHGNIHDLGGRYQEILREGLRMFGCGE
ncbi:RHS repeat domain-containing protein [Amycolatopsis sp. CA-161197]|uniref:RHS repeat domain-containing protein n=1 Tax=Amycolatopsis sp. CA-161197 TaxID=3239922 RepID=UPI003D8CE42E